MTSDEKVDKAERLFKLSKQLKFIDPKYGLYSAGASVVFLLTGEIDMSLFVSAVTITMSLIATILLFFSTRLFNKGMNILTATIPEMLIDDYEEHHRRMARHMEVLKKSTPTDL